MAKAKSTPTTPEPMVILLTRSNHFAKHAATQGVWDYRQQGVSSPAYDGPGLMDGYHLVNWVLVSHDGVGWVVGHGQAVTHYGVTLPKLTKEELEVMPSQPDFQAFGLTPGKR